MLHAKFILNLLIITIGLVVFVEIFQNANAFESNFRVGYTSCVACHHSPRGAGHLSDYGKLVSASQSIFKKKELKGGSGFSQGIQARLANLQTELSNETFPMQGDYLAAFTNKPQDRKIIISLARAPSRRESDSSVDKPSTIETLYFRDALIITSKKNTHYFSAGRSKKNLGPNIVDHTTYNKSLNGFNITDLITALSYDYIETKKSLELTAFAPSFQENTSDQEYGLRLQGRYSLGKLQFGSGILIGKSPSIKRGIGNLFFKYGSKNFYALLDSVFTHRLNDQDIDFNQVTSSLILSLFPFYSNASEFYAIGEFVEREEPFKVSEQRFGVGTRVKINSHFSFRFDYKRTLLSQNEEDLFISQIYFNWWSS